MTQYHAVMLDETRCEFGHTFEADDKEAAYKYLEENYPESKCVQLEDSDDTARREKAMYDRIQQEEDGDFRQYDYEQQWGYS